MNYHCSDLQHVKAKLDRKWYHATIILVWYHHTIAWIETVCRRDDMEYYGMVPTMVINFFAALSPH